MMDTNLDVHRIRKDFPGLDQVVYQKPLVYLDNAATSQKPRCVVDEMASYYNSFAANVHRGAHFLSELATERFDDARRYIADFIKADDHSEIVFTRSTTEAINLVATCLGKCHFKEGDEIILTEMEHHANIVPWYLVAKEKGLKLKIAKILDDGSIDMSSFAELFTNRTKLLAFAHVSNALGTINPIREMIGIAKEHGVPTLLDGAQAIPHLLVNVKDLSVDFYCFSAHKAYGPTGIGVLYGKGDWLYKMPPYQGGGDMIASVAFDNITFAKPPQKFEAGTPHIAGVLGLKKSLQYLSSIGFEQIHHHESRLFQHAIGRISDLKGVRVIGTAHDKVSLISFVIDDIHPHDVSSILDREGIAIRAGHLCAQPLMKRFSINALSRASFSFYNTLEEVDVLIKGLERVFEVFKR